MTYCSKEDLTSRKSVERIAELTGDPEGTTVNEAAVALVIAEFGERLDAAIRVRYPSLPFDATNKYLNGLNVEGAYLLLERDSDTGWSDDQREDWKMLLDELKSIAGGKIDLRTETEEEEAAQVVGYFSTNPRLFGRNSLSGEGSCP